MVKQLSRRSLTMKRDRALSWLSELSAEGQKLHQLSAAISSFKSKAYFEARHDLQDWRERVEAALRQVFVDDDALNQFRAEYRNHHRNARDYFVSELRAYTGRLRAIVDALDRVEETESAGEAVPVSSAASLEPGRAVVSPEKRKLAWPWVALLCATGVAGFAALVSAFPMSPVVWIVGVAGLVFALVLTRHPDNWYRRMSRFFAFLAVPPTALPLLGIVVRVSDAEFRVVFDSAPWVAVVFVAAAAFFGSLDYRFRNQPLKQGASPDLGAGPRSALATGSGNIIQVQGDLNVGSIALTEPRGGWSEAGRGQSGSEPSSAGMREGSAQGTGSGLHIARDGFDLSTRLSVQVVCCVRDNQRDVEQFVQVKVLNQKDVEIQLPPLCWRITDAGSCTLLEFTDGMPGSPRVVISGAEHGAQWQCAMQPRGSLAPGETRILGFRILRADLLVTTSNVTTYWDPFLPSESDQDVKLILVVPFPSRLEGAGEPRVTTSRYVRWEFNSANRQTKIFANWSDLPGAQHEEAVRLDGGEAQHLVNEVARSLDFAVPERYRV